MLYTDEQIAAKLKQVEEFEAKYGSNTTTRGWRKWCTDPKYREREQSFRNAVANYARFNGHKAFIGKDKSIIE